MSGYLSEHSDIVALLVFQPSGAGDEPADTRRLAGQLAAENPPPGIDTRVPASVNELVDHMLFVGEALEGRQRDVGLPNGLRRADRATARDDRCGTWS